METLTYAFLVGIVILTFGVLVLGIFELFDKAGNYVNVYDSDNPLTNMNRISQLMYAKDLISDIEQKVTENSIDTSYLENVKGKVDYFKSLPDVKSVYFELKAVIAFVEGNTNASSTYFASSTRCDDFVGFIGSLGKSWEHKNSK